jgi:hypothetical protein
MRLSSSTIQMLKEHVAVGKVFLLIKQCKTTNPPHIHNSLK